jgi:hypothetical protein
MGGRNAYLYRSIWEHVHGGIHISYFLADNSLIGFHGTHARIYNKDKEIEEKHDT